MPPKPKKPKPPLEALSHLPDIFVQVISNETGDKPNPERPLIAFCDFSGGPKFTAKNEFKLAWNRLYWGAGLSLKRAEKLITQAQYLIRTFDTDPTREPSPAPQRRSLGQFPDPLRLARARTLTVTPVESGYEVTGGAQAHQVTAALHCDCPDQTRHRDCKHVLAVRLFRGELAHENTNSAPLT